MQASQLFGLPCSWAPLQSVPTAASRGIPTGMSGSVYMRGASHQITRYGCYVSGYEARPRGVASRSSSSPGEQAPLGKTKPEGSSRQSKRCAESGASSFDGACQLSEDGRPASFRYGELHLRWSRGTRAGASSRELLSDRSLQLAQSKSPSAVHGRSCELPSEISR